MDSCLFIWDFNLIDRVLWFGNLDCVIHGSQIRDLLNYSSPYSTRAEESTMPTIVIDEIARQHNWESEDLQINLYEGFSSLPKIYVYMYIIFGRTNFSRTGKC
jgi:hypothetical protein